MRTTASDCPCTPTHASCPLLPAITPFQCRIHMPTPGWRFLHWLHPCAPLALQAHQNDMGSACAFSPGQPNLLACLSKGGELALINTDRVRAAAAAGQPSAAPVAAGVLSRQQLPGPVFGCTWLGAGAFGCEGEQLAVVGADNAVRLYDMTDAGGCQRVADASCWLCMLASGNTTQSYKWQHAESCKQGVAAARLMPSGAKCRGACIDWQPICRHVQACAWARVCVTDS